ncbi:NADP transhydrogenase subunit alpha [Sphingobium sp. LB126]|uniref:proton-translocating transhydrogenase family protein n=1 Tax=Sphingobium sp. LB126 TaxID=1983755 RepID=UPI000C206DDB|nr:proton-translocating transhydrogenase family protein [Sphingobium sp. LB126]PJG47555.1 NADP transhydrogenase subunit alpha [Sphingobium sp. LB126]
MTLFLLICFSAASLLGFAIAWRARPEDGWTLVAMLQLLSSAILVGGLIVAAEAGSAAVRILGLLAIAAGSAGLCGGFAAAGRMDAPGP